ncbi:MAG: lysophospholipid acyltransferase family protein, partial [Rhodocyclaceae bacterium]|nr:lysophospholipid acyltransferase family protein [Rhodocyclaceae bacterium]
MRFIFRFLSRLPLHFLHNLGVVVGWGVFGLSPAYRRHFSENWAAAGLTGPMGELRGTAIAEAGKTILELPKLWM